MRRRRPRGLKLVGLVTCLDVSGGDRPTLHEVFRSLSGVPEQMAVFVEFSYVAAFSFRVEIRLPGDVVFAYSESILVLPRKSGRYEETVRFLPRVLRQPPGSYDVVVVLEDIEAVIGSRTVFFGEM